MRHRPLLVILVLFAISATQFAGQVVSTQSAGGAPVVARVTLSNTNDRARFLQLGLDLLEMRRGDDLFILTTPAQINELRAKGWAIRTDSEQTALFSQQMALNTYRSGYRTVAEMRDYLNSKAALYPNLAEVFTYGQSWEKVHSGGTAGWDLFGITLTNRQTSGPKPTFFLMAAIHARELTTSELALRFIDYLLSNYGTDGDVTWLLDEHRIVIVPAANPDGRVIAESGYYQRKNTNTTYGGGCSNPPTVSNQYGVDLNRNSDFKWGTVDSPSQPRCGQTYPGPTVASEPETAALEALVRGLFADQRGPADTDAAPLSTTGVFLTLHSYSNLVLWPWGWTSQTSPNNASFVYMGTKLASYNGFTPEQSVGLYPTSGTTDDWAYGELGIAAMTFEVGPDSGTCGGFFPPFSCLDGNSGGSFWPRNLPAFIYAARIARAPYQLVLGPSPESVTATAAGANTFALRAQFDEQYNGGQNIAAAEYYLDTPPWRGGSPVAMTALDGSFNSVNESAAATVGPLAARHLIYVRGRDTLGNWGPVRAVVVNATDCGTTLSPPSAGFEARGGAGVFQLTGSENCPWSLTGSDSWIAVTSTAAGIGNTAVNFEVRENFAEQPRTGSITVGGQVFTVNQAGLSQGGCAISFTPGNQVVSPGGGDGSINITATINCLWTAKSKVDWITVTSSPSGFGSGAVSFQVAANPSSVTRKGAIVIAGQRFVVKQKGS
ncbi:MAG TPA: M14 family zinc carboxypeptidase [Blastocatellia bacterium]|nr:M14 family zinc carboxypeptidase [Blastocatellia bacterium]